MYVVEIIPLSRTAPAAPLSYRSASKLAPGTLVSVPLRRKVVPGLVVDCIPVREAKFALKAASFSLSKSTDLHQGKLPEALLEAARNVALYHATTLGAVLSALLVPVISEASAAFKTTLKKKKKDTSTFNVEHIEAPFLVRVEQYKKFLDASDEATLLVVPTQTEADDWAATLKKYSPVVLSGKLSAKRREAVLGAAPQSRGLVIATPGFVWVPIEDLGRIIIERMSAGGYSFPKRPYIDARYALTELARARNIPIAYGDYPLPLEYRAAPAAPLGIVAINPIAASTPIEILDVRTPAKENLPHTETKTTWQAIPNQLLVAIKKVLDDGGRVAVLAVRKGYSPSVVCGDCGTAVTDDQGRTLSFATVHRGETSMNSGRVFRSSDGSTIQSADTFCKTCGGWNLKPLGIGVERVEEELRKAFPNTPLVRITEDSRKSASLKKVREEVMQPGTLIIGTELMLPFLSPSTPVELGVIASADSLLALPFWRSRERFVRIGRMLAERAERAIIATRRPEDAALSALQDPHDATFWKEETGLRKILHYPPFGTLIVFHAEGSPARISDARAAIKAACAPYTPLELPSSRSHLDKNRGETLMKGTLVLQLPANVWPDKTLSERLAHLSPAIRIHIDSETFW
jgi:primosomal protein N'